MPSEKETRTQQEKKAVYTGDNKARAIMEAFMTADMLADAYTAIGDISPEMEDKVLKVAENLEESLKTLINTIKAGQAL